jgi:hypothetical protein
MFRKFAFAGALALMAAPVLAADTQTIYVQAGQGGNYSIQVPTTVEMNTAAEPYALTGAVPVNSGQVVGIRSGQGDLIWIRVSQ